MATTTTEKIFPNDYPEYEAIDEALIEKARAAVRVVAASDPRIDLSIPVPENTKTDDGDFDRASLDPMRDYVYLLKIKRCVEAYPRVNGKIYRWPRIIDAINDKPDWPSIDGSLDWAPVKDVTKGITDDPLDTRFKADALEPSDGDYRNYQICSWMFLALDLLLGRETTIKAYESYVKPEFENASDKEIIKALGLDPKSKRKQIADAVKLTSYLEATPEQLAEIMRERFIDEYKPKAKEGYLPFVKQKMKKLKDGSLIKVNVVKSSTSATQYILKKNREKVKGMTKDSQGFSDLVYLPPANVNFTQAFRDAFERAVIDNLEDDAPKHFNTRFYVIVMVPKLNESGGVDWVRDKSIRELVWGDSMSVIKGPPQGYLKAGYYGARDELLGIVVYRMEHKHRSGGGGGMVREVVQTGPAIDPSILVAAQKRPPPTELENTRTSPAPLDEETLMEISMAEAAAF